MFANLVYTHIPKEKRNKLGPSGKRLILVGYSETSKAIKIYILGHKYIEVSRDVTFGEYIEFKRFESSSMEIENEVHDNPQNLHTEPKNHDDLVEPMDPTDKPRDKTVSKKRCLGARNIVQETEKFAAPSGTFRESRRPQKFSNYVALMYNIIGVEPSNVEEAMNQKAWKNAMDEEYQSIIKNDV